MNINLWAVIVAALAQWLLGWAWYGPLFGKTWMALSGNTMGGNKSEGMKAMLWGLIAALVMSFVLAIVIGSTGAGSAMDGAVLGFYIWLGFIATVVINTVLFEKKPVKLFVINVGYYLVAVPIMGAILAAWH